jgi:hypothetical protein
LNTTLKEIFDEFGAKLKEDLQQKLRDEGVEYDGQDSRLSASIVFRFNDTNAQFNLSMNDYWEVINDGRGVNKTPPPIAPLENWIKRKSMPIKISSKKQALTKSIKDKTLKKSVKQKTRQQAIKSAAIAMSKSIGKKGFKGNQFADEIINDGRLDELQNKVSESLQKQITISFNKAQ